MKTNFPLRLVGLLCVSLGAASAQTAIQQSSSSLTSESKGASASPAKSAAVSVSIPRPRFIPVLISVTGDHGTPMLQLTKEQLRVMDNNEAVQVLQLFKAADIPLHLGIALLSSPASFSQQQAAAIELLQKAIRPQMDEAFVVTARGKKPWPSKRLDWKSDPAELAKIVQSLDRNAGLPDAFNFDLRTDEAGTDEDAGRNTVQYFSAGGVNVFDAVYAMMNSDPRPARRVLVIFREPWSHSPGSGNRVNQAVEGQLQRVISMAQVMHIATFVIGLEDPRFNGITDNNIGKVYMSLHAGDDGGAGSSNREFDKQMQSERIRAYNSGKSNVERLAAETGGETFWSTKKNYSDAVSSVVNQLTGQYLVTFAPADLPGPAHRLKITANNGARVLAQSEFFLVSSK